MIEEIATTTIGELRTRPCLTARADETVTHAIRIMAEAHQGAVAVVDSEGQLFGIYTERDVLISGVDATFDPNTVRLGEVATRGPVTVYVRNSLGDALQLIHEGRFRHLPVVDTLNQPVAMISVRDILVHVAEAFQQELVNLPPDPTLEARSLWGG